MPLAAPLSFLRYAVAFSYNIPLANGVYAITVTMVEPNKTGSAQRVFTVTANGQESAPLDLFKLTGADNVPYNLPMLTLVGAGMLHLRFQATAGNAVVSEISITPSTLFNTLIEIGLPLNALDGNGTPIFQAGTAVFCPSAVRGPGAAGAQVTCPAGLYLPLQLVSAGANGLAVANNLSIGGSGDVAPFVARNGQNIPRMAPGYTVSGGTWVHK